MKRWLAVSVLSALVALTILAGVHAQGVTQPFTYQGFLRQGGAPLNNPSQSMRFRIFDALTGGTMLWDSGALTVNVSNGLFTVQLNPPVSVWTGADRFLEIQVGTTTLSPRVRIGATPYANTATLLNMFQSGTTNPDRMVITHSPVFSNWGLQYRDTDDSFHVGVIYSTASNAYGVYASEPSGGAGHAVYASGTLAATGTKSFQIDHPLSPETHYLNHFCAEGPEPMNAYSGVVSLDSRGEAWVQLPDYFEAINRDPRYTLTPIGAAMPNLHVAVKIQNNRFKIAGGAPGKEVSWRIEAVRNDLWVQRYGYQTEQEKEDAIKGKYLSPELYGQPKERGIHYRPEPEPVPSENGEAVRGMQTRRAP